MDIFEAIKAGNIDGVRALLDENPFLINTKNTYGLTPLHLAARQNNLEMAILLLDRGADVHLEGRYKDPPLLAATMHKDSSKMVNLFINKGALVDVKNENLETPLDTAILYGDIQTVKLLLGFGANLDVVNKYGDSPLHTAALKNRLEIIELVVNKDPKTIHAKNDQGETIHDVNDQGDTPLHTALKSRQIEAAQLIINLGADLNIKNNKGETPLDIAKDKGYDNTVLDWIKNMATAPSNNNTNNSQKKPTAEQFKRLSNAGITTRTGKNADIIETTQQEAHSINSKITRISRRPSRP